jgi:uncharacterized protein (DUF362 family)/Pyruvate/2-oxoacid:ferredoxin oxidoreductase delta subunit
VSLVSCRSCGSYEPEELERVLALSFMDLGGAAQFIQPGMRVFCKVNLLLPALPERAVTTHPEFLRAVIRLVRAQGGIPIVGDNPAMPPMNAALRRSGIADVLEEERVEAADMRPTVRFGSDRALRYRGFEVSKAILDADLLLNLPKLKAHALTGLTLAQKNLFGLVPGLEKSRWHMRGHSPAEFSTLLVDLHEAVRRHFPSPRLLHVLDGVLALEGDGPGLGGRPRAVGVILASEDAVSLDRIACDIVRFPAERVRHLVEASARGTGQGDPAHIQVAGQAPELLAVPDFKPPPATGFLESSLPRPLRVPALRRMALERPVLDPRKCVRCGRCVEICASRAISLEVSGEAQGARNGAPSLPRFDLDSCIRCYCCAEICPEGAIRKSDPPLVGRLMRLFS